jgi:hypothetical protein
VHCQSNFYELDIPVSLPDYIRDHFKSFDKETSDESQWYGPVNSLLWHLFPPQRYEVAPQYRQLDPSSVDCTTLFIIYSTHTLTKTPVFFVEIKPGGRIGLLHTRYADQEMRERFECLAEGLVIPKLFGLSLIGSRFAVYEYDKASQELTPHEIPRDPIFINDTAPVSRWAQDFLDAGEGEAKFLEVVQSVKTLCDAL